MFGLSIKFPLSLCNHKRFSAVNTCSLYCRLYSTCEITAAFKCNNRGYVVWCRNSVKLMQATATLHFSLCANAEQRFHEMTRNILLLSVRVCVCVKRVACSRGALHFHHGTGRPSQREAEGADL